MKSSVILPALCGILSAAEAEVRPQPLFGNDFSAVAPGARPPYVLKGEVAKESDGNLYLKLPEKSHAVLNHSTLFYQYGGKEWKNYRFSFRFRYDKALDFNASFRGGGVGFNPKTVNYFNHNTKTYQKGEFPAPPESGKWHTVVITAKGTEMSVEVDGNKVLSTGIPDNRGAINFAAHQPLDLDDIQVTAAE